MIDTKGDINIINVCRENVLEAALGGFKHKTFDTRKQLSVRYLVHGELGIDTIGLRREFMRLANQEIGRLPIFGGEKHCRNISLDYCGTSISNTDIFFPDYWMSCSRPVSPTQSTTSRMRAGGVGAV